MQCKWTVCDCCIENTYELSICAEFFIYFFVLFANNGLLLEMREAIPYRMIDGRRIIWKSAKLSSEQPRQLRAAIDWMIMWLQCRSFVDEQPQFYFVFTKEQYFCCVHKITLYTIFSVSLQLHSGVLCDEHMNVFTWMCQQCTLNHLANIEFVVRCSATGWWFMCFCAKTDRMCVCIKVINISDSGCACDAYHRMFSWRDVHILVYNREM